MRYLFLLTAVTTCIGASICSEAAWAQRCKADSIVNNYMSLLAPYNYESYAVKEITFGSKPKKETIEFTVFDDDSCKLVFCKTEFPLEAGITIYEGKPHKKGGKIIYIDDSGKKDTYVFNFRADKTGSYYIEFEIPPATAPRQRACMVVLIGVKAVKDEEDDER